MTLRAKVIALLLAVFAVYAVVVYAVQRFVLMPGFVELERASATSNVERVVQALQREVELLIPTARDWGSWDDTYAFVVDRNEKYVAANLNAQAMRALGANLLAFYDAAGLRVWGLAYDHEAGAELALGALSAEALPPADPLFGGPAGEDAIGGLYRTDTGPFVVVSSPILTNEAAGPSRGRVVVGRLLDEGAIERLGEQARVQLTAEVLAPGAAVAGGAVEPAGPVAHTPIVLDETGEVTQGRTEVLDLAGDPILRLRVDTPRAIVAQGQVTLNYAALALAMAGLGVLAVLLVTLHQTVLDPLSRLTRYATTIGRQDDSNARLKVDRKDELGVLANELNSMMERLADIRERLLDQSYKSGVAEMASGVLHNIGNAVTPIGVKLTALKRALEDAPAAEVDLARAELADPSTAPERRAALGEFVGLAAQELAAIVKDVAGELDTVRNQVDHIQMILADQQRSTRAERVIAPIEVHRVVEETIRLLPEGLRRHATVEIDPSLARLGRVRASRVVLQQVVSNLLINAAESIRDSGQQADTGRIRIRAFRDAAVVPAAAHLCIEDNGVGIAPEHLARIFERGFSTKARGSGMGLHWSTNTMAALGGHLHAESTGTGHGACFHLLLPLADTTTDSLKDAA
jgi:sensor domain CHASE-containing protein